MASDHALLPGAHLEDTIRSAAGGGTIDFFVCADDQALLVRPRGYVGPGLARRDLQWARRYAATRSGPWFYVVDVRAVRFANPLNVRYLRQLPQLARLAGYVVVVPRGPQGLLIRLLAPLVGARVVGDRASLLAALAECRAAAGSPVCGDGSAAQ